MREPLPSGSVYLKVDSASQGVIQFIDARDGSPTAHWRCHTNLNDEERISVAFNVGMN